MTVLLLILFAADMASFVALERSRRKLIRVQRARIADLERVNRLHRELVEALWALARRHGAPLPAVSLPSMVEMVIATAEATGDNAADLLKRMQQGES